MPPFNGNDIVVWRGIISTYDIVKYFTDSNSRNVDIRRADKEEIQIWFNRP